MHLFSGEPPISEGAAFATSDAPRHSNSSADRLAQLEEEVSALRRELSEVQQQLAAFRKQFE